MGVSAVAREIGGVREKEYLTRIQYGNADPSGGVDRSGSTAPSISAMNRWISPKLYRNELPFKVEHQRLVKDIMIVEAGRDWILRAKTGWQARVEPQIGWWVGWVETPTGAVIFALNIDLPGGMKDAPKWGGDCPIDTQSIEHFRAETCTVFHGASHLCKPFPLRFVTG